MDVTTFNIECTTFTFSSVVGNIQIIDLTVFTSDVQSTTSTTDSTSIEESSVIIQSTVVDINKVTFNKCGTSTTSSVIIGPNINKRSVITFNVNRPTISTGKITRYVDICYVTITTCNVYTSTT